MSMLPEATTDTVVDDRYRILVDGITDYAIYMLDANGCVSSWNAGAQRFKGYGKDEILGAHFSRFYTDEDRERGLPQRALDTARKEGKFENEGWRVRKDGERFWAHVIVDAIRDGTGTLIGFAKITRDLTARKQAEDELRRSQEQLRLLVQGVTDYAIYMLDPEGKVSSWNQGAQRIKGYTPEEIIGEHFSRFYTDEDRADGLPARALKIASTEGRFEHEGWRVRKDGTRFWASVIIDQIRAEDGTHIGFAKVTRDVSEKRAAQEALVQAQKMEALGQLTGGMAHDFNNLLTVVIASLEMARKRAIKGKDVVSLLDNALQGALRGAALTQRLLAFSRKQELSFEAVDVNDLVRGMADLLQRAVGPETVIQTQFPISLPKVKSDPNQFESALLNLCVNARDAMSRGGTITISGERASISKQKTHDDLAPGDYVRLSVKDEGEGMDEKTLASALEPFFTTKGVGKGTGLGLPMVQGLMAQTGGKLVLRSRKGEGTTAELWLPAAEMQDDGAVVSPSTEEPVLETAAEPLSVLAVDDDGLVLMNTVLMLEDLGHKTAQAASGVEALKYLEDGFVPDVVVTDHAMPGMTGSELASKIRQQYPHIPVILATGYAELPQGADPDVLRLPKPFNQTQLTGALQQAVRRAVPA
ncbi:PAS domain S-box protein [Rhizobium leguminosarum]|uniref:hybrid sensor histidine kinase/response regulator n=1 Tax=Rhizobium leguminosarum TaxID=384 RepID=UPI003D7C1937